MCVTFSMACGTKIGSRQLSFTGTLGFFFQMQTLVLVIVERTVEMHR